MTHTKNNIPIYEEQQFLNEEQQTIQKILNDFKQPIPSNYIKLKVEEGNYLFSTNPKWKDKPVSERFGFFIEEEEEKWVQIDIPHNLVEKLEIVKGDDITYPFYLTIDISQKKLIRGAYTIENEEEVFIDKPVSEKNVEKELVKRLKELEILREQVKELEDLKHEKSKLEEKSRNLEEIIQEKDKEISEKKRQVNHRESLIEEGIKLKENLQRELKEIKNKKRSWREFFYWVKREIEPNAPLGSEIQKRYPFIFNYSVYYDSNHENKILFSLYASLDIEENPNLPNRKVNPLALEYDDKKDFKELIANTWIDKAWDRYGKDFERLFNDWKANFVAGNITE